MPFAELHAAAQQSARLSAMHCNLRQGEIDKQRRHGNSCARCCGHRRSSVARARHRARSTACQMSVESRAREREAYQRRPSWDRMRIRAGRPTLARRRRPPFAFQAQALMGRRSQQHDVPAIGMSCRHRMAYAPLQRNDALSAALAAEARSLAVRRGLNERIYREDEQHGCGSVLSSRSCSTTPPNSRQHRCHASAQKQSKPSPLRKGATTH